MHRRQRRIQILFVCEIPTKHVRLIKLQKLHHTPRPSILKGLWLAYIASILLQLWHLVSWQCKNRSNESRFSLPYGISPFEAKLSHCRRYNDVMENKQHLFHEKLHSLESSVAFALFLVSMDQKSWMAMKLRMIAFRKVVDHASEMLCY